jgi:hypothetical protein
MTPEVRARKSAQFALPTEETSGGQAKPSNGEGNGNGNGSNGHSNGEAKATEAGGDAGGSDNPGAAAKPATSGLTDTPPVVPAKMNQLGAGPRLRPVRRHYEADGQLLHVLELRQQHRLRLRAKILSRLWVAAFGHPCRGHARFPMRTPTAKTAIGRGAPSRTKKLTSPSHLSPASRSAHSAATKNIEARPSTMGIDRTHHRPTIVPSATSNITAKAIAGPVGTSTLAKRVAVSPTASSQRTVA